jgi:insulysin
VEEIKTLTKDDMISFYEQYVAPRSKKRAKLSVYLVAQAQSDVSTTQISALVKTLDLPSDLAAQAATDLQARLSAADHEQDKEIAGLREYLLHDLKVAEDKIEAAEKAWSQVSRSSNAANGALINGTRIRTELTDGGLRPTFIKDVRTFKSGLQATAGALPVRNISEYEELEPKL